MLEDKSPDMQIGSVSKLPGICSAIEYHGFPWSGMNMYP
jgi:hypothetical protein